MYILTYSKLTTNFDHFPIHDLQLTLEKYSMIQKRKKKQQKVRILRLQEYSSSFNSKKKQHKLYPDLLWKRHLALLNTVPHTQVHKILTQFSSGGIYELHH